MNYSISLNPDCGLWRIEWHNGPWLQKIYTTTLFWISTRKHKNFDRNRTTLFCSDEGLIYATAVDNTYFQRQKAAG